MMLMALFEFLGHFRVLDLLVRGECDLPLVAELQPYWDLIAESQHEILALVHELLGQSDVTS